MKKTIQNPLCLAMLAITFALVFASQGTAQSLTVLHQFTGTNGGDNPAGGLILSGSTLYGATTFGGTAGAGMVYAVNANGTGFTNLHSFGSNECANPYGGLAVSGKTIYGTTSSIESPGSGNVFRINTDGSAFTVLHTFSNSDGSTPFGSLMLSGNTLYGTTEFGGSGGAGTIFKINVDGSDFTLLHTFSSGTSYGGDFYETINEDGALPEAGLVLSGNTLYGTTYCGGSSGSGTVYALQTDGTGFTNLHIFPYLDFGVPDGVNPQCSLVVLSNVLYGTTAAGGAINAKTVGGGTIFAINTDGTGFNILHTFGHGGDGGDPHCQLLLLGNTLYGTTEFGGLSDNGTIFSLGTDGSGFTVLNNLTNLANVGNASWGLVNSGYDLYGAASDGAGAVFRLSLAPQLSMTLSGTNIVVTWPVNYAGFDYSGFTLQSSTNPAASAVWAPVTQPPVTVNGQYVITNAISGTQMFYRLIQ